MWHHHGGRIEVFEVKQKMVGSKASGAVQRKLDQTTLTLL
jgi:hypothetical protein